MKSFGPSQEENRLSIFTRYVESVKRKLRNDVNDVKVKNE